MAFLLAKNTFLGGDWKYGVSRRDTSWDPRNDGDQLVFQRCRETVFPIPTGNDPMDANWRVTPMGRGHRRGQGTGLGAFGLEAVAVFLSRARGSRRRWKIHKTRKKNTSPQRRSRSSSRGLRGEEATLRSEDERFLGKAQASGRPTAYPGFGGCLHPHNTVRLYLVASFVIFLEPATADMREMGFLPNAQRPAVGVRGLALGRSSRCPRLS